MTKTCHKAIAACLSGKQLLRSRHHIQEQTFQVQDKHVKLNSCSLVDFEDVTGKEKPSRAKSVIESTTLGWFAAGFRDKITRLKKKKKKSSQYNQDIFSLGSLKPFVDFL